MQNGFLQSKSKYNLEEIIEANYMQVWILMNSLCFLAFGARFVAVDAWDRGLTVCGPAWNRPTHTNTLKGKNSKVGQPF